MKEAGNLARYSVYIEFINGKVYEFETVNHPLHIKPIHVIGAEVILTEEDHAFNRLDVMKMDVREIGNERIDYFYRAMENKGE